MNWVVNFCGVVGIHAVYVIDITNMNVIVIIEIINITFFAIVVVFGVIITTLDTLY